MPCAGTNPKPSAVQTFKAYNGADGGGRTHTSVRTLDFESSASANSATSASCFSGVFLAILPSVPYTDNRFDNRIGRNPKKWPPALQAAGSWPITDPLA